MATAKGNPQYPAKKGQGEDASYRDQELNPNDSISQWGSSGSSRRGRSITPERARAMTREIESAAKAKVSQERRSTLSKQDEIDKQV